MLWLLDSVSLIETEMLVVMAQSVFLSRLDNQSYHCVLLTQITTLTSWPHAYIDGVCTCGSDMRVCEKTGVVPN